MAVTDARWAEAEVPAACRTDARYGRSSRRPYSHQDGALWSIRKDEKELCILLSNDQINSVDGSGTTGCLLT
jgi:hypothetical protein